MMGSSSAVVIEEEDFEEEDEAVVPAVEDEDELAEGDVVEDDDEALWRTEGSVFLGRLVRRSVFEDDEVERWADGTVVGWLSAAESDFLDAAGQPAALYRVEYHSGLARLRGEREDLEEIEVRESLVKPTAPPLDDDGSILREPKKCDYELLRESNIQRNNNVMLSLGLVADQATKKTPAKRRKKLSATAEQATRKSPRLEALQRAVDDEEEEDDDEAPAPPLVDNDSLPVATVPEVRGEEDDPIEDDEIGLADELDDLAKTTAAPFDAPAPARDLDDDYAPWSTEAPSASDILGFIDDYERRRARPTAAAS